MTGLWLALVAAGLTGCGASDQIVLAQLSNVAGRRAAPLATAVATATIASVIAAWAGWYCPPQTRWLLALLALAMAGARLLMRVRIRPMTEPTNSLGAAAIVLLALQIADSSRLMIFAIALCWPAAQAASGGALGSAAALAIGWSGADRVLRVIPQLRRARRALGVILIMAAATVGSVGVTEIHRLW